MLSIPSCQWVICLPCSMLTISTVCVAAFIIPLAALRIKAPTLVNLAPFSSNWATHDHKSEVQLQTHVQLLHCFMRLFVYKTWQSVGRKQGRFCCLRSVAEPMLITWGLDKISIFGLVVPYFKSLMGWDGLKDIDHMSTNRQTVTCTNEHTSSIQALNPEWCSALSFDMMIRKARLWRTASTPELELKLLHHLWHHLMTLICNLTSWTLPDY